jgi:predicted small integral membrane protein
MVLLVYASTFMFQRVHSYSRMVWILVPSCVLPFPSLVDVISLLGCWQSLGQSTHVQPGRKLMSFRTCIGDSLYLSKVNCAALLISVLEILGFGAELESCDINMSLLFLTSMYSCMST